MQVIQSRQGQVLILAVQGSLDILTSPELERTVQAAQEAGEKMLLFDLGQLAYVSSAGLRVFISAMKRAQGIGGQARFCALNKSVKQIFDVAGLSLRGQLFASVDEAVKSLASP